MTPEQIGQITVAIVGLLSALTLYVRSQSTAKNKLSTDELEQIKNAATLDEKVNKILAWMDTHQSEIEDMETRILLEASQMVNKRCEPIDNFMADQRRHSGEL